MPKSKRNRTRAIVKREVIVRGPVRKRQSRRRRRQPKNSLKQNPTRATYELVCSVQDPFSCAACIPDGSTGTGCFSIKEVHSLSDGVGGSAGLFALNADPNANHFSTGISVATSPTVAGNWLQAPQIASMDSLYASWRPVSMGMRASYQGSTTSDSGVLLVGQVSGRVPLSTFNGLSVDQAAALCMNYQCWPLRNGTKIRWDPESDEDQSDWQDLTTAATAVTNGLERQYLVLIYFGAAASQNVLFIESVVNYEGIYRSQSFMPGGLNLESRAPAEPGWYERAKAALVDAPRIFPYVGAAVSGYTQGGAMGALGNVLGTMANGLPASGRLSLTGLPRQRMIEL